MHDGKVLGVRHAEPLAQATFDEAEMALRDDQAAGTQRESVLGPKAAREDLLTQSGLLTGRGDKQLGFYHLSIEEFLAAERIFELRLDDLKQLFVERAAVPNWRNTLSLLFGRFMGAFSVATRPLALLSELIGELSDESFGLQLVVSDCAEMLGAKGYRLDDEHGHRLRQTLLRSMIRLPVRQGTVRCGHIAREDLAIRDSIRPVGTCRKMRTHCWDSYESPAVRS